jgi:CDP-diglyceride synthetase
VNLLESDLFWDNAIMMVLLSMILEFFGCIFIAFCSAYAHTSNFIEPKSILILVHFTQAADLGGIFAGKAFGKNKLIPSVSPGKTVEGILGCFLHA